jgi:hypothetical protein
MIGRSLRLQAMPANTSFRPFDRGAEVVALALERVDVAVEFADAHDAVGSSLAARSPSSSMSASTTAAPAVASA